MNQPYIHCGLGWVGVRVLEHLRAAGAHVVIVNNCPHEHDAPLAGVPLIVGDCRSPETLERAASRRRAASSSSPATI